MAESPDINALVNAAVEKALGGNPDSKSPPTPTSQPAPTHGESSLDKLARVMELQLGAQLAQQTAAYKSPGAPSSAPSYSEEDPGSLLHADRSVIENLRRTGKFKGALEAYYRNLPGGRGSVFPGRDPK